MFSIFRARSLDGAGSYVAPFNLFLPLDLCCAFLVCSSKQTGSFELHVPIISRAFRSQPSRKQYRTYPDWRQGREDGPMHEAEPEQAERPRQLSRLGDRAD